MKSQEKKLKRNGAILAEFFSTKQLFFLVPFIFFLFFSIGSIQAQSIPGTGTSAGICGNCNPTGWADADPNLDGTPDISNRNQAGGEGFYGANATWTAAPLPLPPTGDVRWITLRDVGTSGSIEENVTTTMTGLTPGTTYKLVISTMTSITNADGGTGGNEPYAGQYIEDFDIQVGANPRRTIIVPASSRDVWGTSTIIFIASSASETFTIFPGADSNAGNVINDVEMIHISVDGVSALQVLDTDGDGVGDTFDIDDDNDGILDITESGGLDPNGDEDGDGIANYQDVNDDGTGDGSLTDYTDANADGFPDAYDFDGDGVPNHLDLDSDNDGILDNVEAQTDAGFIAFSATDTDGDGLVDVYDATVSGGASGSVGITPNVFDSGQTNDDTTPDYLDIDTDDDGIPDNVEAQSTLGYTAPTGNVGENGLDSAYENVDTYTPTGITIENTDLTDLPDYRDTDSDNDGTTDINENGEGNVLSGSDTDGDGLDNNFDADNVNYDVNDNITTPSTDLPDVDADVNTGGDVDFRDDVTGLDSDGDKIPDTVDIDDDDDGIIDTEECSNTNFPAGGADGITVDVGVARETEILDGIQGGGNGARMNNTNDVLVLRLRASDAIVPAGTVVTITTTASNTAAKRLIFQQSDASGNNTSNDWNVSYNSATSGDQNFTGSGNGTVFTVTYTLATDATHIRIGMTERSGGRINMDYLEYAAFSICSPVDTDGDGITDDLDIDSDNDGIIDNYEAQSTAGYIPKSGNDVDGDGLDDAYDDDLGGAANSNGITQAEWINTDGSLTNSDTIPDHRDIDSDNDGIPDNIEAQTTSGYTAPNGVPGNNGLDSAYGFNDSFANTGLSTSLINTDGDAEPDYRDTDADGDGTNDDAEGRTGSPSFTGSDTDGDGLDNGFDNVDTTGGTFDVNDDISDPEAGGLIDADVDVTTGGDVDYRDTLAGQDTDGDGIVDTVDIDDDNDGIIDTVEDVCVDGTSVGTAFTSLGQARNVSSAGVYFFNLNGNAFSTYVDENGYVQVAIDFGNGSGDLPQGTALTNSSRGILSAAALATLTDANEARISHSGGNFDVTTSNATILSRITTNTTLHQGTADNTINNDWTGTEATAITVDASCTTSSGTSLHQNVAHLCGNTSGYHWIPSQGTQRIRHSAGSFSGEIANGESFTLWVRADSATTCSDFDGDGIPNSLDLDSDGDGILDNVEAQTTAGFVAPPTTGIAAAVGANGLFSIYENNDTPAATGLTPNVTTATDTTPDYLDIDTDDDGIPDNVEAQTTTGYTAPSGNVGLNGVDSEYENNDTFTAVGLTPNNNDGTDEPDYRDTDSDNDTTSDADESGITLNAGSLGTDSDGDGLDDIYEGSDATAGEAFDVNDEINDPVNNLLDADNDGATTGDVDYRDDTIFIDTDGDGVEDSVDIDDDNDGILDINEDALADGDGDGIPNRLDIDSDNDGIPDNVEAQLTIGYIAPSGSGSGITDADGDGLDDNYDNNTSDTSTGASVGLIAVNTDNITGNNTDTNPDYLDTDSDGDGINDILENGNANTATGTDTDGDGLDDAFEGVLNDNDVNDDIDDPATDLPDIDSDVNTADGAQPDAPEYNDVDYRDIDDDRAPPSVAGNILWLRADIGVTGVGEVTNWADQSGNSFNATNTGTGPAKLGDGTATDGLNFNPTLQFTEASGHDLEINSNGILGNAIYDHIWIYAVTESNSATNASFALSNAVTGGAVEFQVPTTGSLLSLDNATGTALTTAWGGTANVFNIWNGGSSSGTSTPSGTNKAIYRDGLQLATNNTGNGVQFSGNNSSTFIGSDSNGANFFDGQIAEIMVFNTAPTSAVQQKIQSYLAIKYGITLDQTDNDATIAEGDYVIDGSPDFVVWDESANSTYHNDVAGIGRDDGKFLNQKQSRSINSSSMVTIGLSSVAANNGSNSNSFNADGAFLMWGHNGVTVNNTNTSSMTLLCESELQLDREWKIVETGSVGSVEIAAVQATIDAALTTPNSETIILKIADDADFTTNVKHIPVTTRTINGVPHYVANFDFDGTKYFTYSEVLGIFWNGDTVTVGGLNWTGGAANNSSPATDDIASAIDGGKVLVVDSETSQTNAILTASANVECLWVKPNTKLIVNDDQFIEFNQDLLLEGEIRLIGDAQLVQSHTGLSNVQGNGVIYRDQASNTPSVYRYNYWSSPVVAALGNTTYSTSTVMFDGTTPTSENSTATAINWQNYNGTVASLNSAPTNPITIATWWIYAYFNGTTRADWSQRLSTGAINIGEGFIMKSTGRAPQNFTFMGSPNDGTITKVLTPGTTSLLGNPYPSVIDTQQFISDNSAVIDGTLYFWEHQGETSTTTQVEGHGRFNYIGGYSQRNEAMGVAANSVTEGTAGLGEGTYTAPPQFIAVGQGFFASAPANKGGTLTFENSHRAASTNNIFFRNTPENLPNFKLGMDYVDNGIRFDPDTGDLVPTPNFENFAVHRQLGINFKQGNDFAYQSGFDSRTFDLQPTDIFWDFEEIEEDLIIAGVGALSAELQIPLGVQVQSDDPIAIMIDEVENMDGYNIYLGDLVTGLLYNLESPVELDLPKGTYTDRFVLLFGGTALSNDENPLLQGFHVFMNNKTDQIIIRNNNNSVIKKVELFNILGQPVHVWKDLDQGTEHQLDVYAPTAIYIVKVTTDKGEITRKIAVD